MQTFVWSLALPCGQWWHTTTRSTQWPWLRPLNEATASKLAGKTSEWVGSHHQYHPTTHPHPFIINWAILIHSSTHQSINPPSSLSTHHPSIIYHQFIHPPSLLSTHYPSSIQPSSSIHHQIIHLFILIHSSSINPFIQSTHHHHYPHIINSSIHHHSFIISSSIHTHPFITQPISYYPSIYPPTAPQ